MAGRRFSIHRGDLHLSLVAEFIKRAGADRLLLGWQCTGADEDGTAGFRRTETSETLPLQRGCCVIGADGIHSTLRKQLYPDEGEPHLFRRQHVARRHALAAILGGAAMIRCGWFTHAKMVIYPIRNAIDGDGRQLVNWVVEIETPQLRSAGTGRARDGSPISSARSTLAFRLARRAGILAPGRCRPRISDGRQGSAAALELRADDALRRRRASDVSARLQRGRPGNPRRPRARRQSCRSGRSGGGARRL